MPILSRSKALDATGQPVAADALYESLSPHARGNRVFPVGYVLAGDDPDLLAAPGLWVREDLPTPAKRQARIDHVARRRADVPEPPPDPTRTRISGLIPPERRRRALRNYHDRSGLVVHEGSLWDSNDEFVKGNPDMFAPEAA